MIFSDYKNANKALLTLLLCFLVSVVGVCRADDSHEHTTNTNVAHEFWTCAMHPQIKLNAPGQCPICGMNLIRVSHQKATDQQHATLQLSDASQDLANIQTSPVERRAVRKELRLVGSVDYDETRLKHITAWLPGRIERMFVDYTGITVNQGDHMLEIYSPELIAAQEELIQAQHSLKAMSNSSSPLARNSTARVARAAKDKLKLLGLTDQQVERIINQEQAQDRVVIYAPLGGIVVDRAASEGMYVNEGTRIYSIADLSSLWIHLDAYESDLPWIHFGQPIEFYTKALPGTKFKGIVSFIAPVVNPATRTTKIRVSVDNSKRLLKPGLFVTGVIHADVFGTGKVVNKELKGKFIGPMHPEIIQDHPGTCPICGMDLVPAEQLGYVTEDAPNPLPLVIPETAPLITGDRAVVYVKKTHDNIFEARSVILGPKATGFYIVVSGLKENELVVTRGAFKIDADLQIKGQASMMNPSADHQPLPSHSH